MGTTYRYLEEPGDRSLVLEWMRAAEGDVEEVATPRGVLLHFKAFGPLVLADDGRIDALRSPLATILVPRVRRGILWTVGEIHFPATPLRRAYPRLHRLNRSLAQWLQQFECVFANGRSPCPEWQYHLEGAVRNRDSPIFALPGGLGALRSGRYFVADEDTEWQLDTLCRALKLRGIQCGAAD